ncbi:MAG TPA: NADH-quinone oxidoreductase subunit N [Bacteroidales bacterium]|nr:NADH-quinone oxidoreductase subunit N [Bacteroidales bacterium]
MYALISSVVLGIITMFLGIRELKRWLLPAVITGLVITFGLNLLEWNRNTVYYNGMMTVDNFSVAFNAVLIFTALLVFIFARDYYRSVERPLEDIYSLMLFALAGALVMTSFSNIAMLFIGIEILSISMYILAGSKKFDLASNEAAMKYFLTGSFATCFLLFGIALVYGSSASFDLNKIADYALQNSSHLPSYFRTGILLIMIGLSFKLAVAPFHFWAPDVYHGSPTLITAYMSTVVKTAGIAAFYKLFITCFHNAGSLWSYTLMIFAALTIITGNLAGIFQDNMKRMLAYSSISHAGYMLLGILSTNSMSAGALLLYSASYSVVTIAAFGIIILVREVRHNDDIDTFNGLARTNPYMAFTLTVAMLSLTGIPPLAGFTAKYYIFSAAMQEGHVWLVVLALLGSAVSAVYYFKPVIAMYMKEGSWPMVPVTPSYRVQLIAITILTLVLGIVPGLLLII